MNNINYPSWQSGISSNILNHNIDYDAYYIQIDDNIDIWNECEMSELYRGNGKVLDVAFTYTEILKWLREKHKLVIEVTAINIPTFDKWCFDVYNMNTRTFKYLWNKKEPVFNTYEEALDSAILHCLTILKEKDESD